MHTLIPLFFTRRFPLFAKAALIAATMSAGPVRAAEAAVAEPTAIKAAVQAPEDRAALLERLTKVLKFGAQHGARVKPGKVDAVIALGLIGDERSIEILVEHLQNEETDHLRLQIIRALGWIGSAKAVPALERALQDKHPFVRQQAAAVLKQITGRSYDFDKTGLPSTATGELDASPAENIRRLDRIAEEIAKRRELREALSSGSETPVKQKAVEPVDIVVADLPVAALAKTYSELAGKLVLVSPKLARVNVSCKVEKASRPDALAALRQALEEAGVRVDELDRGVIAFVPCGNSEKTGGGARP